MFLKFCLKLTYPNYFILSLNYLEIFFFSSAFINRTFNTFYSYSYGLEAKNLSSFMISSLGPAELCATIKQPAASISTTDIPKCSASMECIP